MHYKNLAFAALAGIVLLSSCVKDLETKSVTDIRNAKLEEIKSQTALNNAEAAAKKTLADAEALLMAAQAEAQKAQAEYIKAQAAYQQAKTEGVLITNQQKAAELETALINAEIAKEKAQAELDNLAMQLEKDFLEAQKELLEARAKYNSDIADAYAEATLALLKAQNKLANLKIKLTSAEEELVDLQTSQEELIVDNNVKIAEYEKIIAAYKENMGMTEEELATKLAELNSLRSEKYVLQVNANNVYSNSYTKLSDARSDINDYAIGDILNYKIDVNTPKYSFNTDCVGYYINDGIKRSIVYKFQQEGETIFPIFTEPRSRYSTKNISSVVVDGKKVNFESTYYLRTYDKAEFFDNALEPVASFAKEKIAEEHETNVYNNQWSINYYTAIAAAAEKAVSEYDAQTKALNEEKEKLEKEVGDAEAAYWSAHKSYLEYADEHYNKLASITRAKDDAKLTKTSLESEVGTLKSDILNVSNDIVSLEDGLVTNTKAVKDQEEVVKTKTTAVTNAQKAYDEHKTKVVDPLLVEKDKKYAEYRKVHLEYLAGTATEEKDAAAEEAYNTAFIKWKVENDKLEDGGELYQALSAAQSSLDTEEKNLNEAKKDKTRSEIALNNSKEKLEAFKSELAVKVAELEKAKTAYDAAEAAYNTESTAQDYLLNEKYNELVNANNAAYTKCITLYPELSAVEQKIKDIKGWDEVRYYDDGSIGIIRHDGVEVKVAYSYEDPSDNLSHSDTYDVKMYQDAVENVKDYKKIVEDNKVELDKYNASFDEFNKQVDEWLEKVNALVESEAAYSADIDALNELENTTFELYKEYVAAKKAVDEVDAEITALTSDKSKIEGYLEDIKQLKEDNTIIIQITEKEQLIAKLKVKIANKEQEIKVLEKNVEDLKAALDAALAEEEENTTEE